MEIRQREATARGHEEPRPFQRNGNQSRGGGPSTGESMASSSSFSATCSFIATCGKARSPRSTCTKGAANPHWLWQPPAKRQGAAQVLAAGWQQAMASPAMAIPAIDASWHGPLIAAAATGPLSVTSMASTPRMANRCRIAADCSQGFRLKSIAPGITAMRVDGPLRRLA